MLPLLVMEHDAANGVILVTTKKGRTGKNAEFTLLSFTKAESKPDQLTRKCATLSEYSELMNRLYMNKAMLNPAKITVRPWGEYTLFRTPEEIELYRN